KRKSTLVAPAWARKRVECRESKKILTKMAKGWLEVRDGKFVFKRGAKETIRRIFALATAGHGYRSIVQTLTREGVECWNGKPWYEPYLRVIIHGREVLGEFQQGRRKPDGGRDLEPDPVLGYYPRAVSEAEWHAAHTAIAARGKRGGRPAKDATSVNVF